MSRWLVGVVIMYVTYDLDAFQQVFTQKKLVGFLFCLFLSCVLCTQCCRFSLTNVCSLRYVLVYVQKACRFPILPTFLYNNRCGWGGDLSFPVQKRSLFRENCEIIPLFVTFRWLYDDFYTDIWIRFLDIKEWTNCPRYEHMESSGYYFEANYNLNQSNSST